MPGGMGGGGGLDSLIEGLVRGVSNAAMKGAGLQGGGMGGMRGIDISGKPSHDMFAGRHSTGQEAYEAAQADSASEYDIDRWKRADELEQIKRQESRCSRDSGSGISSASVTTPTIQAVKDDWEKKAGKESRKKEKRQDPEQYLNRTRTLENDEIPSEQPKSGTIVTKQMKQSQRRIGNDTSGDMNAFTQSTAPLVGAGAAASDTAAASAASAACGDPCFKGISGRCDRCVRNYLGLSVQSDIEGFFTKDPLNSLILAADQLSLSPLALDTPLSSLPLEMGSASSDLNRAPKQPRPDERAVDEVKAASKDQGYIQSIREARETEKYEVRIVG